LRPSSCSRWSSRRAGAEDPPRHVHGDHDDHGQRERLRLPNYERLIGAEISILELPGVTATTGIDATNGLGYFEFKDFPEGRPRRSS